jgi:hypothetical protein
MDQAACRAAIDTLDDVSKWRLQLSGWEAVGRALEDMRRSLAAGDPAAFLRAVADVRRTGPRRIVGLENAATLPLPEQHRERVNQLIHDLSTPPQNGPLADPDDTADTRASG